MGSKLQSTDKTITSHCVAAFLTQTMKLKDPQETTIKYEIWDTAGQERYHSLAPMYYRGAQAAVIVYDITSASSFEKAKQWIQELKRQGNPGIVMALVGNKLDLQEEKRLVNYFVRYLALLIDAYLNFTVLLGSGTIR